MSKIPARISLSGFRHTHLIRGPQAHWITDGIGASWLFLIGGTVIIVLHFFPIFLRDIRTME